MKLATIAALAKALGGSSSGGGGGGGSGVLVVNISTANDFLADKTAAEIYAATATMPVVYKDEYGQYYTQTMCYEEDGSYAFYFGASSSEVMIVADSGSDYPKVFGQ